MLAADKSSTDAFSLALLLLIQPAGMNLNALQTPLITVPPAINGEATKESNEPFTDFAMLLFSALAPAKVENSGDPSDGEVSTPADVLSAVVEQIPILPPATVDHPAKPDEAFTPNPALVVSSEQPMDASLQIARGTVLGSPSLAPSESANEARALIPNPLAVISGSADGAIMAAIFDPHSPDRGASGIDRAPDNGEQVIIEPPLSMELAQTILSASLPAETKSARASEQGDSIQPELDGPNPVGETSREGNDPLANFGNSVRDAERGILQTLLADPAPAPLSNEATESIDAALGGRASAHRDIPSASHAVAAVAEAAKNNHSDGPTEASFMNPALTHSGAIDSPPQEQRPSAVIEPSKRDQSDEGNAIGRGHVSGSEKNPGQIVSVIARGRSDELTPRLKLGHQPPFESGGERNEQGLEKPVEAVRNHAFLTDQSEQRQSSLGRESRAWPRESEKTSSAIERPINPTTVANGSIISRQEPRDGGTADTGWRPVIERLADDIVNHARIGQRQAVLQLDPPELGKIKIDLRIEDGKLHAHITAEVHDSKLLIETHLPELRQALLAGQRDTVDLQVVQGDGSGSSGHFGQGLHHSPQGQQETGWSSNQGSAKTREAPATVSTERSGRQEGHVSMWA